MEPWRNTLHTQGSLYGVASVNGCMHANDPDIFSKWMPLVIRHGLCVVSGLICMGGNTRRLLESQRVAMETSPAWPTSCSVQEVRCTEKCSAAGQKLTCKASDERQGNIFNDWKHQCNVMEAVVSSLGSGLHMFTTVLIHCVGHIGQDHYSVA